MDEADKKKGRKKEHKSKQADYGIFWILFAILLAAVVVTAMVIFLKQNEVWIGREDMIDAAETTRLLGELNRTGFALILTVTACFGGYILLLFLAAKRRKKSLIRQKDEMESIVYGINRLFARFVLVDLEKDTYRYLMDYSDNPSRIDREGKYTDFVYYFQRRILETTGDTGLEDVLEPDYLRTHIEEDTPYLSYNFRIRRDKADHWENASIICLTRKNGIPAKLLFAIQDVSELKHRDEKTQETIAIAFQAAKDANLAKSDFLSRMSHDMRTPLNAVIGMATIAKTQIGDEERVSDCLDKILLSGRHLLDMINEILDMSKIESDTMELSEHPFSLRQCLRDVACMFEMPSRNKNLTVSCSDEDIRHDMVCADEERLRKILVHVIDNAVRYTPEGGRVFFSVYEKNIASKKSACYEFVCEDTGIGMSESFLSHIFEPFVAGRDSRTQKDASTGLGLPIARGLAKMMDGDIEAESQPQKGSRFTVRVVMKLANPAEEETAASGEPADPDMRYDGTRILLAEDNAMNAEMTVEFLKMFGIETDVVENGRKAVEVLMRSWECPYDMVFMDVQMPVMSGIEATRAIRASGREDMMELPIVAVTANTYQEDIARMKEAGMNDYMAKPLSHAQLAGMLRKWIKQPGRPV